MNRAIYPTSLRNLQWIGSSDRFTYIENNAVLVRKASATASDTLVRFREIQWNDENFGVRHPGQDTFHHLA